MKGAAKQKWGKFTDDDLDYIAGSREHFIGKLQERYGIAKEEAQKRADQWLKEHPQSEAKLSGSETRRSGGGA
jgi:uncharacterized protein YjbJ (UPF0337 family)